MTDPNPTPFTEQQLLDIFRQLGPVHGSMLGYELDTLERKRFGGLMLPHMVGLVGTVARCLTWRPDLFPDAPATGAELEQAQKTAFAWMLLRDRFRAMAQLAGDAFLAAQGSLNGVVLGFVNQAMRQQQPAPLTDQQRMMRNLVLAPAFMVLAAYYRVQQRQRVKNQAAKVAKAAPPAPPPSPIAPQPPQPQPIYMMHPQAGPVMVPVAMPAPVVTPVPAPPPPPVKSPQKLRAEADRRAHVRRVREKGFLQLLWQRHGGPSASASATTPASAS